MGLFAHEDGRPKGWLATFLCCIAAVNDDEHPTDKSRAQPPGPSHATGICNEQPVPLLELPHLQYPVQLSAFHENSALDDRGTSHAPLGTPDHEPPPTSSTGERKPSFGRRSLYGRMKPAPRHVPRPSISAPNSFRRVEYTEGQRASLVPLRLGPVVLSEIPTTDLAVVQYNQSNTVSNTTQTRSDSTQELLSESDDGLRRSRRESYFAQRETPFQRCQSAQTILQPNENDQHDQNQQVEAQESATQHNSQKKDATMPSHSHQAVERTRPPLSAHSSSSSLRRQAIETNAAGLGTRSLSSERHRPRRKRSLQSIRKPYAESGDLELDKEVLELNTIVEERRTESARSKTPEQSGSEQTQARPEVLSDIGSAFFRPSNNTSTRDMKNNEIETLSRPKSSRGLSQSSSRVSGWLSGIMQSSTSPTNTQEPFYKCVTTTPRQRAYSEASLCSSVSELESPSLTIASSPTSKGHSRSLTADSRVTSLLSPPSTACEHGELDYGKEAQEQWQVAVVSPSQVGLAL